jgi:hypothetical protein
MTAQLLARDRAWIYPLVFLGEPGWDRTSDTLIKSQENVEIA